MIKLNLFLLVFLLIFFLSGHSQNKDNTIALSSFTIELDGSKITLDTIITAVLTPDNPTDILIFKNNFVSYRAVFTYIFKGRRAKLVRRTYAVLPDGTKVFSKQKKDMQELKVSVPGLFKDKSAESILYDRKTMGSIFVSFKYEYLYK